MMIKRERCGLTFTPVHRFPARQLTSSNLSVIAVALIGVCLAVVFMGFKFNGSHAAAGVDSDYDPLEDDED